ncbi:MAG: LTA synthase family protein [Oscillospiraceae bacterium]|nr:LTA synthase family protein [Oscillospiraceae bacterium]
MKSGIGKIWNNYRELIEKHVNGVFWSFFFITPLMVIFMPEAIRFGLQNWMLYEYMVLRINMWILSYLFILMIECLMSLFIRRYAVIFAFMNVLSVGIGTANLNMLTYRSLPLTPADILLAKDAAAAVQNGFSIIIGKSSWILLVAILVLTLLLWPVRTGCGHYLSKLWKRFAAAAGIGVLMYLMLVFVFFNEPLMKAFGHTYSEMLHNNYYMNTYYTEFIKDIKRLFPSKPENYSADTMALIGEQISEYKREDLKEVDIIAIQVESWFAPDNYDVVYEDDLFENYHRLAGEGVTGLMVSPKYGGGTADIEYEVLTGFTSNDEQSVTTPFNINMHDNFPGLVRVLKLNGYGAFSIHSFNDTLYNRLNAYPMLGFDRSYFSYNFDNPEMRGTWISDQACIEKVIEVYEAETENYDHVFVYGLTMQNHIPVDRNKYTEDELISAKSGSLNEEDLLTMRHLGTTLREIDAAIGYLADYLRTVDRDVILVVWGDHQIDICKDEESGAIFQRTSFYDSYVEERDFLKLHTTPYLVWTNFSDEHAGESFGLLVPNMIMSSALEAYDVIMPTYWNYFVSGVGTYDGVTANYLIEDNKVLFEMSDEQKEEYHIRQLIQYDVVHGKNYIDNYLD